nr:MAG TPA: hypothetical protein [Caudoviricetes sp.]
MVLSNSLLFSGSIPIKSKSGMSKTAAIFCACLTDGVIRPVSYFDTTAR